MPICRLLRITCHEQEDLTGDDDAYIVVNGKRVWGPKSMDTGQTREIQRDVQFSHRAKVVLYEQDDWDDDDYLGAHTLTRADIGRGEQEIAFAEDDASYTIWMIALNDPGR